MEAVSAPVRGPSVRAAFQRACRVAGIRDLRWHDLRHEAASRLAEDNVSLPMIMQIMGWTSMSMVRRYAHHSNAEFDKARSALVAQSGNEVATKGSGDSNAS